MEETKVIIVVLQQPNRSDPYEKRTDPLWEFGSFGCTGCHRETAMNPKNIIGLNRARLAFAQGGTDGGFKLVHLTPPIEIVLHGDITEAKWKPINMPFKYTQALLLIKNNSGESDFPLLKQFIESAKCPSWESKFSSKFRARRMPLDEDIAAEGEHPVTQIAGQSSTNKITE